MLPADAYKKLLNVIKLALKNAGYSCKGRLFYIQQQNNWGLIQFQKSLQSTSSEIIFTINLGINSDLITNFLQSENNYAKPDFKYTCWQRRVGELIKPPQDKWWIINSQTNLDELINEIKACILDKAIPEINHHILDENLQSLWLSGQSPGLTNIQRLINLSILLKFSGADHPFNLILSQLKMFTESGSSSSMVRAHLKYFEAMTNGVK